MKILFVIHCFPPERLGGSEIYTANLAAELGRRHEVSVFTAGEMAARRYRLTKDARTDFTLYRVHLDARRPSDLRSAYGDAEVEQRFVEVLDAVRPDVVHVQGVWTLSNSLPILARRRGIPVVFTLHDFWLMCPRGQRLRPSDLSICWEIDLARCTPCLAPWIDPPRILPPSRLIALLRRRPYSLSALFRRAYGRLFRRRPPRTAEAPRAAVERYHQRTREVIEAVDLFVAPSMFLRGEFVRYGIPPERILYSDTGMDVRRFDAVAKVPSDTVRFGFVGSLMPSKGAHVLVDAFRGLDDEHAELLIFGEPPPGTGPDYVESLRRRGRHPGIRFIGRFPPDRVGDVFSRIDVLVVPSLWFENSPLVIQEAFLSKTPVIASRLGGMAEHVRDGTNGILFSAGDIDDLREAMRRVIRTPHLLSSLRAGILPVKSMRDNAAELEATYARLVSTAPVDHAAT